MTEQTPITVIDLAKELGKHAVSLVDELKALNINVKNHMSELSPADVQRARDSFAPKKADIKKTAAKKTGIVKTRKKSAEAAPTAPTAATTEPPSTDKKLASPIIRRRATAEGHVESVAHGLPSKTTSSSLHPDQTEVSHIEPEAHVPETSAAEAESLATSAPSSMEGEAEIAEPQIASSTTETHPSPTTTTPQTMAPPTASTPSTSAPTPTKKPPIILTPRPVAPRRSILTVIDPTAAVKSKVKVVEVAPPAAPAKSEAVKNVKGATTTQDKDGFRIIRMTKENLDQMAEEEAAKKRGGGKDKELDINPEDVRFADYRKKEMVFLPKKKKIPVGKEIRKTTITTAAAHKRIVEMHETISVQELANQMHVKAGEVIKKLMGMGQMATINQAIDYDTATLIATEFQHEVKNISFKETEALGSTEDKTDDLTPRPPVVTIMGHVDHGKTTLLDSIREANVAAGEAGGITQHIGAYTIEKNGKCITFIDTPGHEAFTAMRTRGANVTDIVILVVSADDGVMPQTREALSHAQAAKVPIIVAVNKIDKPGANPEKIKQGLAELNLLAEDWGGETMFVPVSALKKTNIDKLLDSILLQAEMLDLKANSNALASGSVLETRLEKGRGPVVSLLINRGTLKIGDAIVSGTSVGRVKAMVDHTSKGVKEATPGIAVEILGFESIPNPGDPFNATEDETTAREIAENRINKNREKASAAGQAKVSLEDLFSKIQAGDVKELNVILKTDVFGSMEAIRDSLTKISTEKVKVKVIHAAPGGISESDVLLASASSAIIIGFNVRPETKARQVAEREHIDIKCYNIIYELIDDVKKAMTGLLEKKKVEKYLGRAEVRQIFTVPKMGVIAGSSVVDGKIVRGANVRLLRESRIIFEGKMGSLKRFKDDAKEVAQGFECGIGIENYNDLKPGDLIEAYQIELITPSLEGLDA